MDDLNLTTDVLRRKTKDELIALLQAQARTNAGIASGGAEINYDFEHVIHSLFDESMIPMIMVDRAGRFLRLNRAFKDLTGYSDADLVDRTIGYVTHPTDHGEVDDLLRDLKVGEEISAAAEKKIVRKDGSIIHCKVKRLVVRDQSGAVKFLVSEVVDLTDQQNQSRELYRQRSLFEALFFDMTDALVFVHPDRTIRMYNSAFARLMGYDEHELIGTSTRQNYVDPEEFERQGRLRYHPNADDKIGPHTVNFRRKDGSIFAGETIGTIVRDENGTQIGFMGLLRDVTDREKAHEALVQSERRFHDFAQAGAYRFWETDVDGRYTYLSPANKYFPNSEELLIGRYQYKSPNFSYEERDLQAVLERIARHEPYHDFHHSVLNGRGRRYRASSAVPVFDSDGTFAGYRGVSLDETGEMLARREAETLSVRFHAAIENFNAGFALWSSDRKFVACNEFYRKSTGSAARALVPDSSFEDFIRLRADEIRSHRKIDVERWIQERLQDFELPVATHDYSTSNGEWYRITKQQLANGDTLFFLADITVAKVREGELINARSIAESASRAKSEFLSNVSHELRTPLNAILGFAQIFERASPSMTTEKFSRFGGIIRENGAYLLDLINGILDLSAIEAGRLNLADDHVNLASLAADSVKLVELRAQGDNIRLVNSIGPAAPNIRVDQIKLKQVLVNILTNAIKFTPTGGQVEMAFVRHADALDIVITDNGIGMTDEEISISLEKFGQVGRSRKAARDGIGLGLPLAKELIEAHGGRLGLASVPDGGTSVTISLPGDRVLS